MDERAKWGLCWVCNTEIPQGSVYCLKHTPPTPKPPPPPIPPETLIAIDPSKRDLGWAVFVGQDLLSCGLAKARTHERYDLAVNAEALAKQIPVGADVAVIERMVHYPSYGRKDTRQRQDAIANDLLDLQAIGAICACASGARKLKYYTPHEWKGPRPKSVVHKQIIRDILTVEEQKTLNHYLSKIPEKLRHNTMDAVGIGLRHVRRLLR